MKVRSRHGNMLALVAAVTVGILIAVLFFALNYVRMVATSQQQSGAIQAAVLAAADDISRVVVTDSTFGRISLADNPLSKMRQPPDRTVHGINSILGTVRLDMIIADQVDNAEMKRLAESDYNASLLCVKELNNALKEALKLPSNKPLRDANGDLFNIYTDALRAYQSYQSRTGGKSVLTPDSLKLTLGCVPGLATNTSVPTPMELASVTAAQQMSGKYLAYQDIPYRNKPFVFAALAQSSSLIDPSRFNTKVALPFFVPTVVMAQADVSITDKARAGSNGDQTVQVAACAQPGSAVSLKPQPGAFTITFPDGSISDLTRPSDIFSHATINNCPVTAYTAKAASCEVTLDPNEGAVVESESTTLGGAVSRSFYDWFRRAGLGVNIMAAKKFMSSTFAAAPPKTAPASADSKVGNTFVYSFNAKGGIDSSVIRATRGKIKKVEQNQVFWITKRSCTNSANRVDALVTDRCYGMRQSTPGLNSGAPIETDFKRRSDNTDKIGRTASGEKTDHSSSPSEDTSSASSEPVTTLKDAVAADITFRIAKTGRTTD